MAKSKFNLDEAAAFHPDFADIIVTKDATVARRMLATADLGLCFARALVAKDYKVASGMLTTSIRKRHTPTFLQKRLKQMIRYRNDKESWPTHICVVTGLDITDMKNRVIKKRGDFGWVYVSIDGAGYCEAVSLVVVPEGKRLAICEIEWGRP